MKIARVIDSDGNTCWCEPATATSGRLLVGDSPFDGLAVGDREVDIDRWLAPVDPPAIYGIGLNYRAHAAETGAPIPDNPVMFMKPPTAVIGPDAPILLPAACTHGPEVDYEAELAVIIGRRVRNVSVAEALDCVFGYTCANDVSARRWQKQGGGGQWVRGKSFDTFCPLGPWIVTADEIPSPQGLGIGSILNRQTMQSSSTADMIFDVATLIAFISRDTTLAPGTVILTGTPEGVGFARQPPVFLQPGDTIEIHIEGIGSLANPVRNA